MRIFWKIAFSHLSKQQSPPPPPLPPNQCCGSRASIRETNFTTLIWGRGHLFFFKKKFSQKFLSGIVVIIHIVNLQGNYNYLLLFPSLIKYTPCQSFHENTRRLLISWAHFVLLNHFYFKNISYILNC